MKCKRIKRRYNKLEQDVHHRLIKEVKRSETYSDFMNVKALNVNLFDYNELVILHNTLTFIDKQGHQFRIYDECSLEDLIDIVSKI